MANTSDKEIPEPKDRAKAISRLIAQGYRADDIVEYCRDNWGEKKQTAEKHMRDGWAILKKNLESVGIENPTWRDAAAMEIYRRCVEVGDNSTALRALKDIHTKPKDKPSGMERF